MSPGDSGLDLPLKIIYLLSLPPPPSPGTQSGIGELHGIEVIEVIDYGNGVTVPPRQKKMLRRQQSLQYDIAKYQQAYLWQA